MLRNKSARASTTVAPSSREPRATATARGSQGQARRVSREDAVDLVGRMREVHCPHAAGVQPGFPRVKKPLTKPSARPRIFRYNHYSGDTVARKLGYVGVSGANVKSGRGGGGEPELAGHGTGPKPFYRSTRSLFARDRPLSAFCDGDDSLAQLHSRLQEGACRPRKSGLSLNWVSAACPGFFQGFGNCSRARATALAWIPKVANLANIFRFGLARIPAICTIALIGLVILR